MSLAQKIADKQSKEHAHAKKNKQKTYENFEIAEKILKARRRQEDAFPSSDIETLVEMSLRVCAKNFSLYPQLNGIENANLLKEVSALLCRITFFTIDREADRH